MSRESLWEISLIGFHEQHLQGRSMASIARELGLSRERVRQLFEERGLEHGWKIQRQRVAIRRVFHAVARAAQYELRGPHGSALRYQRGCRCDECRRAASRDAFVRRFRQGKVSPNVCAVCGGSVWKNDPGGWRHYRPLDHAPQPVPRRERGGKLLQVNPEPLRVTDVKTCAVCHMRAPWCTCGLMKYR